MKPEWIRPKQVKELFGLGANLIQQVIRAKRLSVDEVAKALRGMTGESRASAVQRLVAANVCERTTAYALLKKFPGNIEEDSNGKLYWRDL